MIAVLFVALAVMTVSFIALWIYEIRKHADTPDYGAPNAERVAVGFFANFFDALGIGSFATSTTYFRLRKLVRDELIPGTLNVGHCLPTITQAFIGIAVIAVEPSMLVLMIATAVAGLALWAAARASSWVNSAGRTVTPGPSRVCTRPAPHSSGETACWSCGWSGSRNRWPRWRRPT